MRSRFPVPSSDRWALLWVAFFLAIEYASIWLMTWGHHG